MQETTSQAVPVDQTEPQVRIGVPSAPDAPEIEARPNDFSSPIYVSRKIKALAAGDECYQNLQRQIAVLKDPANRPTEADLAEAWDRSQRAYLAFLKVLADRNGSKAEINLLQYRAAERLLELMERQEAQVIKRLREGLGKRFRQPRGSHELRRVRKSLSRFGLLAGTEKLRRRPSTIPSTE